MNDEVERRWNNHLLTPDFMNHLSEQVIFILWFSSRLILFQWEEISFEDLCTTGKNGLGEDVWSHKSPRGIHSIWWIIWHNWNIHQQIKHKKVTGKILLPSPSEKVENGITSRVLILNGLESHNISSYSRSIYIHWSRNTWFWDKPNQQWKAAWLRKSLWCFWLRPEKIKILVDTLQEANPEYWLPKVIVLEK